MSYKSRSIRWWILHFEPVSATFATLVSELRKERAILDARGESMLKKVLSVVLSGLLISVTTSAVYARAQDDKQTRQIEKVKENVVSWVSVQTLVLR